MNRNPSASFVSLKGLKHYGISTDDTMVTSKTMLGSRQAERDHVLNLHQALGFLGSKEHHKGRSLSYKGQGWACSALQAQTMVHTKVFP